MTSPPFCFSFFTEHRISHLQSPTHCSSKCILNKRPFLCSIKVTDLSSPSRSSHNIPSVQFNVRANAHLLHPFCNTFHSHPISLEGCSQLNESFTTGFADRCTHWSSVCIVGFSKVLFYHFCCLPVTQAPLYVFLCTLSTILHYVHMSRTMKTENRI